MIGKKIEFKTYSHREGVQYKNGIILDSVLVEKPQYKFDEYTAAQRGFNFHDGQNRLGSISVTAYLVECDGAIGTVEPNQIIKIID